MEQKRAATCFSSRGSFFKIRPGSKHDSLKCRGREREREPERVSGVLDEKGEQCVDGTGRCSRALVHSGSGMRRGRGRACSSMCAAVISLPVRALFFPSHCSWGWRAGSVWRATVTQAAVCSGNVTRWKSQWATKLILHTTLSN